MSSPSAALLHLLRLSSPALPVGGYSYSRGIEWAVEEGWVRDESTTCTWVEGVMRSVTARLDAPVLLRLHRAWSTGREVEVERWAWFLHACRESAEIRLEERCMAEALARLLAATDEPRARPWIDHPARSFPVLFALAASARGIDASTAVLSYLWVSVDAQVSAAVRLVPLGQTQAHRVLTRLIEAIDRAHHEARSLADDDLGGSAPGAAMSSMFHESQYSRLFRS